MSERIKQLWDDAALASGDETTPWEGQVAFMALFAELIIKETIKQMAIQMNKFGDDQSNNPDWYKSEEAVKKHFGIQE